MNTSTQLAIVFGSVGGALVVVCVTLFVRFKFRSRTRKSFLVDSAFGARLQHMAEGEKDQLKRSVLVINWGIFPVAGVGPNRTKTYFNGWFGLDNATGAGWTRERPALDDRESDVNTVRESHWSKSSRRSTRGGSSGPPAESVDDLGMLEKGGRAQVRTDDYDAEEAAEIEDERVEFGLDGEHDSLRPAR